MERTGWFVQHPIIGSLNEQFLMLRAVALALRARLRQAKEASQHFLSGAATPPLPRRGIRLSIRNRNSERNGRLLLRVNVKVNRHNL